MRMTMANVSGIMATAGAAGAAVGVLVLAAGLMAQPPASQGGGQARPASPAASAPPAGAVPAESATPKLEFAFEELVTLGGNVNVGDTPYGSRNFITITGGTVTGPKFKGKVFSGGWDYQMHLPNGCGTISADYFLQADDGAMIHVDNKAMTCPNSGPAGRILTRPVFEAPKGPYEWMNSAVFVGTLEMGPGGVRIRFYQAK